MVAAIVVVIFSGIYQAAPSCQHFPNGSVLPGDSVSISCPCNGAVGWSASAGSISGNTSNATLSTNGAAPGNITVTAHCASSSLTTTVTIAVPAPPPPAPATQELCAITFTRVPKQSTRVDNGALACLDDIALDMQRLSDASVYIVGTINAQEVNTEQLAAQRAVNAKDYLVKSKGIGSERLHPAVAAGGDAKTVHFLLVPAGATFPSGLKLVDETKVKPIRRKPTPPLP